MPAFLKHYALRLSFFTIFLLFCVRSYWITDLVYIPGPGGTTWAVSCSRGLVYISKSTFQKQPNWPPPARQIGYCSINDQLVGAGAVPVGLFAYRLTFGGPSELQVTPMTVCHAGFLGFGRQTGILGNAAGVWIKCDEVFAPIWGLLVISSLPMTRHLISACRQRRDPKCGLSP
jgi:hypothetical protein